MFICRRLQFVFSTKRALGIAVLRGNHVQDLLVETGTRASGFRRVWLGLQMLGTWMRGVRVMMCGVRLALRGTVAGGFQEHPSGLRRKRRPTTFG